MMDLLAHVLQCCVTYGNRIVTGVMKMGNTVYRTGFVPTSLAFQASVLPLRQVGSLITPHAHLSMQHGALEGSADY